MNQYKKLESALESALDAVAERDRLTEGAEMRTFAMSDGGLPEDEADAMVEDFESF